MTFVEVECCLTRRGLGVVALGMGEARSSESGSTAEGQGETVREREGVDDPAWRAAVVCTIELGIPTTKGA
jgi:hypothetical protein